MPAEPVQLDLEDYPRAPGWQNQETSIEAAEVIAPELPRLQQMILDVFRDAGDTGLTSDQAASRCRLTPFSARPRVTELVKMGLLVDGGFKRRNASGRKAIVWIIAPKEAMAEATAASRMRRKRNEAERAAARVMKEEQ